MVNFDTRTLQIGETLLIENGKPVNGHVISETSVTLEDIEQLYTVYETSFPDKPCSSMFRAKPENELSLSEMVYGKNRSIAQQQLEQTLLEAIISHNLIYPDKNKWFWQSQKNRNLIIPRWIFTQECHRNIVYRENKSTENELWDRNVVGRRLRKSLNTETTENNCLSNMTIKECLITIKEEIAEHEPVKFFTDEIIEDILMQYMSNIPKQWNKKKATIGQYISRIRKAKTPLFKIRAIDDFLENNMFANVSYQSEAWQKAYEDFVDYRTLMFIKEFIPNVAPINISGNIKDYTEKYITDNFESINKYVASH